MKKDEGRDGGWEDGWASDRELNVESNEEWFPKV